MDSFIDFVSNIYIFKNNFNSWSSIGIPPMDQSTHFECRVCRVIGIWNCKINNLLFTIPYIQVWWVASTN